MKKIIIFIVVGLFFLIKTNYFIFARLKETTNSAVMTPNITITKFNNKPTLTPSSDQKTLDSFKEKVANKVQEMMKKNNKAVSGVIVETSKNLIKIKDLENKNFDVKIDENLTKFYKISGSSQKEIKISEINKNDYIIVSGIISDKIIDANLVFVDERFLVGSGKVMEVDKENFNIKVIVTDKTVYNISIESTTKQQILNIKTFEIEKAGFSKIIVGDRIHFVSKIKENQSEKSSDLFEAIRILIIPQEYFIK